jgi:DNA-binding transcriptional ArsR family regulator
LTPPGGTTTDEILRAIAEPKRRAILQLVAGDELAAGEIAAHFAVTRPAISQHLTILKDAGLLSERREGARRLYRARPEELAELRAFLETMWPATLERFKAAAEGSDAGRGSPRSAASVAEAGSPVDTRNGRTPRRPITAGLSQQAAAARSAG